MDDREESGASVALAMEGFWTLMTNLHLLGEGPNARSLLITSARPGEGKSTIAANLAVTVAHDGRRVLLVDADFRRPTLHQRFDVPNEDGLSEYLCGTTSEIHPVTVAPNLELLPTGKALINPPKLLNSDAMRGLVKDRASGFDLAVIDSAPVLAVSDCLVLSSMVDGVILVVAADKGTEVDAKKTKARLEQSGAKLLGTVLNRFDEQSGDAYHPYASEYHA